MRSSLSSMCGIALVTLALVGSAGHAIADYADTFDAYADGVMPPGWTQVSGPGFMGITSGTFAHRSTYFNNWCYDAYVGEQFGEGTFDLDVNVSSDAWNNVVLWRWDATGDGGQGSMQLVFRTSPLIPPTEYTRLYEFQPGGSTVLAEVPVSYTGLHHVTVQDQGTRVVVKVDGVVIFDVVVSTPLPAGFFGLNPGDWGGGGYYDNVHLVSGQPTPVRPSTWGGIKQLYSTRAPR